MSSALTALRAFVHRATPFLIILVCSDLTFITVDSLLEVKAEYEED